MLLRRVCRRTRDSGRNHSGDVFLQKKRDNLLIMKIIRNFAARYVQFGEISYRFVGLKG